MSTAEPAPPVRSPLVGGSSRPAPRRAPSDLDRTRVIDRFRAVAGGALELDALESLIEAAWQAPTWSDLESVAASGPRPPPPDPSREVVAAVGWPNRRGQGWEPADVVVATAVLGNVVVDLTEATWDGRPLRIMASVVAGGAEVVVPADVSVALHRWSWLGSTRVVGPTRGVPSGEAEADVAVHAHALAGSVTVRRHAFRRLAWRAT